jgi:hypothetical protein
LQLSLHDEIVLVEVVDSWDPNPERMPVMLHHLDGSVKEVGSTQLLRECVRELRTEQAILDGSANVVVLQEIARSLGGLALPGLGGAGSMAFGVGGDEDDGAVGAAAGVQKKSGGGLKNGAVKNSRRRLGDGDSAFVDGASATHATPAALAEAAEARRARLGAFEAKKVSSSAASEEKETARSSAETESDFSPEGDVVVMERAGEDVEDLEITSQEKKKGATIEVETGPR